MKFRNCAYFLLIVPILRIVFTYHVGFGEAELYPIIQNQSQVSLYIIESFDVPLINGSLDAGIPTRDKIFVTFFHTVS